MTATVQIPISRNYLSSDLFSPGQSDRQSIPSLGVTTVKRPPLGGNVWGTEITRYGGIGALPFLGKVKVKDLPVPRSHRHFSSGVDNFQAVLQPHDVTSLLPSACRQNDQLLPPVGTVNIDSRKCHVGPILEDVPYSTHIEKSEMFPRGPDEDNKTGGRHLKPVCPATHDALADYRKKTYNTSTYDMTWGKDPCISRVGKFHTPCTSCCYSPTQPKGFPDINENSSSPTSILSTSKDSCRLTKRVRFADQDCSCVDNACRSDKKDKQRQLGGIAPCWPPSVYKLEKTFQIKEDMERLPIKMSNSSDQVNTPPNPKLMEDAKLTGNSDQSDVYFGYGGNCPAEMCKNTFCDKVVERDCTIDDNIYSNAHTTTLCERWAAFENWRIRLDRITNNALPPLFQRSADYGNEGLNQQDDLEIKEEDGFHELENEDDADDKPEIADDTAEDTNDQSLASMCTAHLRLPRQPFPNNPLFQKPEIRKIPLPPIHLSQCLLRSGDRIPCRLGLRFKTEAYKRFHAMHPDPVPDLRRSHNERKRYFFYGYHSTGFRG